MAVYGYGLRYDHWLSMVMGCVMITGSSRTAFVVTALSLCHRLAFVSGFSYGLCRAFVFGMLCSIPAYGHILPFFTGLLLSLVSFSIYIYIYIYIYVYIYGHSLSC